MAECDKKKKKYQDGGIADEQAKALIESFTNPLNLDPYTGPEIPLVDTPPTEPVPVNDIVERDNAPTPETKVEDKKESADRLLQRYEQMIADRDTALADTKEKQTKENMIRGILAGGAKIGQGVIGAAGHAKMQDVDKDIYKPRDLMKEESATQKDKLSGMKDLIGMYEKLKNPETKDKFFRTSSGVVKVGADGKPVLAFEDPLAKSRNERLQDQLDWKKIEKDEISDKQVEEIRSYDKAISDLETSLNLKTDRNIDTGLATSVFDSVRSAVGMGDADISDIKMYLGDTLAERINQISGTAASDTERDFLSEITVPSLKDNDVLFVRKLKTAIKKMKKAKDIRLDAYKKQGKDPSAFMEKKDPSTTTNQKMPTNEQVSKYADMHKISPDRAKQILINRLNR